MKEKEILLLLRNDKLTENDKKYLEMYIEHLRQTNDIYRKDIEALKNNYNDLIEMCENKFRKIQHCYCSRTDCGGRIKDNKKYNSIYQEKECYKSKCETAIRRISLLKMNDITIETNRALDLILNSLVGSDEE